MNWYHVGSLCRSWAPHSPGVHIIVTHSEGTRVRVPSVGKKEGPGEIMKVHNN